MRNDTIEQKQPRGDSNEGSKMDQQHVVELINTTIETSSNAAIEKTMAAGEKNLRQSDLVQSKENCIISLAEKDQKGEVEQESAALQTQQLPNLQETIQSYKKQIGEMRQYLNSLEGDIVQKEEQEQTQQQEVVTYNLDDSFDPQTKSLLGRHHMAEFGGFATQQVTAQSANSNDLFVRPPPDQQKSLHEQQINSSRFSKHQEPLNNVE